jgi:hypothetical protein
LHIRLLYNVYSLVDLLFNHFVDCMSFYSLRQNTCISWFLILN